MYGKPYQTLLTIINGLYMVYIWFIYGLYMVYIWYMSMQKKYLVGGIPTPLKNMSSSVGMMTFPIY